MVTRVELTENGRPKRTGAYFTCKNPNCKREFYAMPSEMRKRNISYCSLQCRSVMWRGAGNPFYGRKHSEDSIRKMIANPNRPRFGFGKDNPDYKKSIRAAMELEENFLRWAEGDPIIEPKFSKRALQWNFKKRLAASVGKCEDCGLTDKRLLTVHHLDRNTKNNVRSNLAVLCPNCHALRHIALGGRRGTTIWTYAGLEKESLNEEVVYTP